MELLEALEDCVTGTIATLVKEIYDTCQILPDISESISTALPKKPDATECGLHRMISLVSQIPKYF